jgi:hypothetical protein
MDINQSIQTQKEIIMKMRSLVLIAAGIVALLYMWPAETTKAAKKIGDVTVSAVKSGLDTAKK